MKNVLIYSELWSVVDGSEVKESATERKWIERDEKALATITLCMQATQLHDTKNCKTSARSLEQIAGSVSPKWSF